MLELAQGRAGRRGRPVACGAWFVLTFLALPSLEVGALGSRPTLPTLSSPRHTHTHTHTCWCLGSLKGDVQGPVSGPVGLADLGMMNVPPALTASVPHLGALPIPFNEPLVSPQQEAAPLPSAPPVALPALSPSLFVPLSLDSSGLSPTPFPSLPPAGPPGAWGAGEPGSTYKPEPLFDNLFLSSSCWQAAGEEQKVNETLCGGITATASGGRASQPW